MLVEGLCRFSELGCLLRGGQEGGQCTVLYAGVVVEAVSWSSFPMQEGEQEAGACRESCGFHGHSLH